MKITLTNKEAQDFFYNALCNAVGTGYMRGYGLELNCNGDEYDKAKKSLVKAKKETCMEDVWMQILREGGTLTFTDLENDGEYTRSIKIEDVNEKVAKMPIEHLSDMVNENDDAVTSDVLLQTVFFGEVIFG